MKSFSKVEKVLAVISTPPFGIVVPSLLLLAIVHFFMPDPESASSFQSVLFPCIFFGSYALSYYLGRCSSETFFENRLDQYGDDV